MIKILGHHLKVLMLGLITFVKEKKRLNVILVIKDEFSEYILIGFTTERRHWRS